MSIPGSLLSQSIVLAKKETGSDIMLPVFNVRPESVLILFLSIVESIDAAASRMPLA